MDRKEHLIWLLVDLVYDLVTPGKVFRDYLENSDMSPDSAAFLGIARMCKISCVLSLVKLHDILKDYGIETRELPSDIREQIGLFRRFCTDKKLVRLRNKFAAHNFDDFESSSYAEGEELFTGLFGKTLGEHLEFFEWVCPANPSQTFEAYHPAYLVTRMRNYLASQVAPSPRI
ncbi:hypothetical protein [Pseudomonas rhizoryzae]|uniref:hypothetical protein n=1 Tax=Pseudomonas rhizoryzae TaxID=2571129 RepID=UPI0010C21DD9|nr:hypothetical protein [Pseudomonas rhizoryzae]